MIVSFLILGIRYITISSISEDNQENKALNKKVILNKIDEWG